MAAFALVLATNPVLAFVICPNFSGAMGILLLLLSCAVCIGCTVFLFVRTGRVPGSDEILLGESGALPTEVLAAVILFTPLLGMALGLSLGAVDVVIAGIGTAGGGVMLITHDIELALRVADRVATYIVDTTVRDYGALHEIRIEHVYETFYVLILGIVGYLRTHPDVDDEVLKDLIAQTLHMDRGANGAPESG